MWTNNETHVLVVSLSGALCEVKQLFVERSFHEECVSESHQTALPVLVARLVLGERNKNTGINYVHASK